MLVFIGKFFVYLGNVVVFLLVLILGYKCGVLVGGMGLVFFDVMYNYIFDVFYYFIEIFIVGGSVMFVFYSFYYNKKL